ncbi:hypothetical protein GRI89_09885 [Altererythrobacter salegens]|uniref:Uncharacterized protein n=1 Tax=Croceibacterium salegens TaxID=1737568 RepID=A0A6I4SWI1_9SPHN|nr:hypothetical protein [Croceibacterium salegens]MXO59848.1 hypothetical protein [Croceibacterium salegens]
MTWALCRVGTMFFIAAGAKFSFLGRGAAKATLLVLPILAVTTLRALQCRLKSTV